LKKGIVVNRRFRGALRAGCFLALFTAPALANPRPLPFTYPHEQLPEGSTELEQFADFTPVRARDATTGGPTTMGLFQFQTEFEHGITDRLELGLYVVYAPGASNEVVSAPAPLDGNGIKQRLRYKLADTGAWPIDVSLYGELFENQRELEVEGKIILQRRIGPMRLMANLTAEQEFYYDGHHDLVLAPSGGATFEVTPGFQPGVEWWMRAEYPLENAPSSRPFGLGPHQYVGPAVLLQHGPFWWTTGAYFRVSDRSHTLQPGEAFGDLWIRTVVGLGF
jgi:hypothetical protein